MMTIQARSLKLISRLLSKESSEITLYIASFPLKHCILFYSMISELEKKLNVTFPSAEDFEKDSFRQFLDDLCVKHDVECSYPRTAARLLDKVLPPSDLHYSNQCTQL